jgi:hypothetical protein
MANLIRDTSIPLKPPVPVGAPAGPSPSPGDPTPWQRLDFEVQHQQYTQWCWAAVSVSIVDFYENPTAWSQCKLVCSARGINGCCEDGESVECNRPWYIDQALNHLGAFGSVNEVPRSAAQTSTLPPEVERDIADRRPVALAIEWDGGRSGHAIVLEGYRTDGAMVAIEDPWEGASDMPVHLLHRYRGTGTWTHFFRTQPPSPPTQPPP